MTDPHYYCGSDDRDDRSYGQRSWPSLEAQFWRDVERFGRSGSLEAYLSRLQLPKFAPLVAEARRRLAEPER